jgi:hypothetical protein
MYEDRITIFIDILGFRNIVEKTKSDIKYSQEIFSVLDSMSSSQIKNELFGELNVNGQDSKEEEKTRLLQSEISHRLIQKSSIKVTHFSDSIVLSIGLENDMYAMSMIEYVSRLIYRLWKDFKILIRGGIAVGKLSHVDKGPLFGPAMVKAYDIETNLANYPRIILDNNAYQIITNSPSYKLLKNIFKPYSGEKVVNGSLIKIEQGFEMNLATSFKHLMNSHFTVHPANRKVVQDVIDNTTDNLKAMAKKNESLKVKEKYDYLITELEQTEIMIK